MKNIDAPDSAGWAPRIGIVEIDSEKSNRTLSFPEHLGRIVDSVIRLQNKNAMVVAGAAVVAASAAVSASAAATVGAVAAAVAASQRKE